MNVGSRVRQRKSIRLQEYDLPREIIRDFCIPASSKVNIYHGVNSRAGAYFVTSCTHERKCLFGEVVDGEMELNENGKIVKSEWLKTGEFGIIFQQMNSLSCRIMCMEFYLLTNPLNDLGNQPRIQFPPLFPRLRQRSANKSTNCEIPRVFPYGNAIILNTLSATTTN